MRASPTARAAGRPRASARLPGEAPVTSPLGWETRVVCGRWTPGVGGSVPDASGPSPSPLPPPRALGGPSLCRRHRPQLSLGGNAFHSHEVRFPWSPQEPRSRRACGGPSPAPGAQSSVFPLEVVWLPVSPFGLGLRVCFCVRPEHDSPQRPPTGVQSTGRRLGPSAVKEPGPGRHACRTPKAERQQTRQDPRPMPLRTRGSRDPGTVALRALALGSWLRALCVRVDTGAYGSFAHVARAGRCPSAPEAGPCISGCGGCQQRGEVEGPGSGPSLCT